MCGPVRTRSLGGNYYYLPFIDDYTSMNWVYFLQIKSQVFDYLSEIQGTVEKQSGSSIKILRLDKEGEFLSSKF